MPEFCTSCGEAIQPGSGFCMKCGAKVDAQPAQTPAPQAQPARQQYAPPPAQQTPQQYAQPQAAPQQYAPPAQDQSTQPYAPIQSGKPPQARRPANMQSDRTVALYDQDMSAPPPQPQQPNPYAAQDQVGFAPKRQAVYPQQQQTVNPGYPPRSAASSPAYQSAQPAYHPKTGAGMGMNEYLINLLIMSIPFAGLIISILWGLTPEQPDRSNLAKAMIVFNVIWMVLIGTLIIVFYNTLSSVADVRLEIGF